MIMSAKNPFNQAIVIPDDAAFTEAYHLYSRALLNSLYRMTNDYHLAEDLLQILWVYVYRHYPPEDYCKYGKLLWKAKKLVQDAFRNRQRRPERALSELEIATLTTETDKNYPMTAEEDAALRDKFFRESCVYGLSTMQQVAVWWHLHHGYTLAETSEKMKTPCSTTHDCISKARQAFVDAYNK